MGLDRRISFLEAKKAPRKGPDVIWWLSPTTEEDLRRGWQLAIRNYLDHDLGTWDTEEVRVDAAVYSATGEIEVLEKETHCLPNPCRYE
jgi:hypothetical protein